MAAPLLPRRAARSDRPTATFRAGIELPELRHAGEAGLARTGRGAQLGGHSTPLPPSLLLQSNAEDYQKFAGDASRKHVTVRAPRYHRRRRRRAYYGQRRRVACTRKFCASTAPLDSHTQPGSPWRIIIQPWAGRRAQTHAIRGRCRRLPTHALFCLPWKSVQWPKVLNAPLSEVDPELADIIEHEKNRQYKGLELIPSENFVSASVMEAVGSGEMRCF